MYWDIIVCHVSIGGGPALLDPSSFWESRPKLTPPEASQWLCCIFFFSSLQQNSSSGEALYIYIYIYIYIYLSPSSIKLLISQEEQLCFKPLGQEDYSCLFFSFILFKRSNKDGYLTGVIYALFLTRMGRRWQLGP